MVIIISSTTIFFKNEPKLLSNHLNYILMVFTLGWKARQRDGYVIQGHINRKSQDLNLTSLSLQPACLKCVLKHTFFTSFIRQKWSSLKTINCKGVQYTVTPQICQRRQSLIHNEISYYSKIHHFFLNRFQLLQQKYNCFCLNNL